MSSPAEHAATVREALRLFKHHWLGERDPEPHLDALVALAERATELERDLGVEERRVDAWYAKAQLLYKEIEARAERAEQLETALREAEDERDQWQRRWTRERREDSSEGLRNALSEIAELTPEQTDFTGTAGMAARMRQIARAALDGGTATPELHNPADAKCSRWVLGEPTDPDARCLRCRGTATDDQIDRSFDAYR